MTDEESDDLPKRHAPSLRHQTGTDIILKGDEELLKGDEGRGGIIGLQGTIF